MRLSLPLFTALFSLLALPAAAAGYTNLKAISSVEFTDSAYVLVYFDGSHGNPLSCSADNTVKLTKSVIDGASPGSYEPLVSGVITAMAAGRQVRFYVDACQAGTSQGVHFRIY